MRIITTPITLPDRISAGITRSHAAEHQDIHPRLEEIRSLSQPSSKLAGPMQRLRADLRSELLPSKKYTPAIPQLWNWRSLPCAEGWCRRKAKLESRWISVQTFYTVGCTNDRLRIDGCANKGPRIALLRCNKECRLDECRHRHQDAPTRKGKCSNSTPLSTI